MAEGKTVLFFSEGSIRTRVSFEKGIKMLGGDTILFPPEALTTLHSVVLKDMKLTEQMQNFIFYSGFYSKPVPFSCFQPVLPAC